MKSIVAMIILVAGLIVSASSYALENAVYCESDLNLQSAVAKINGTIQGLRPRTPQIIGTVSSPSITVDGSTAHYVVCVRITTNN